MLSFLTRPKFPHVALGITKASVTSVSVRKDAGGGFSIDSAATAGLEAGVLNPGFASPNIIDEGAFVASLERVTTECGLRNKKLWSVALPGDTARSAIHSISEPPSSKRELEEILDFKAETAFGLPAGELRVSRIRLAPDSEGSTRFLSTAIAQNILEEYEAAFGRLGWRAGLVLPKAVSEMKWLEDAGGEGDSLLISSEANGFTAVLLRRSEPVVVRSISCTSAEIDDEIFRLLVYYQDRFMAEGKENGLTRFLAVGGQELTERLNKITSDALGKEVSWLSPGEIGLSVAGAGPEFSSVAAPAALARCGWT